MNKADKARFDALTDQGCIVCRLVLSVWTPPDIHHLRSGVGMGQRSGHERTIPLCHTHHQGQWGIHAMGTRAWEAHFGYSEERLLTITNALLRGEQCEA
ncbi:MAG: hypothetical protein CMI13_11810 [Oleibacter sp.]|nr:hypothetical protein [Thalassolituus sp.]